MKAAVVREAGRAPVYADFAEPVAGEGERIVTVAASALSPLARARASGRHYSSANVFPFVAGVDGVGRLEDGTRAYFVLPRAPFGAMAERSVVSAKLCLPLPDGVDDLTAATIANPGMSSWAALTERARFKAGETVLINGATGASGTLAVQIARYLGAKKVIATGRDRAVLESVGADAMIPLIADGDALEKSFAAQFADGIDVVIDYLWGMSAERILYAGAKTGREGVPIRFVQVGTASGADIALPGAVLRSSAIELMGSGIGSVSMERLVASVAGVFEAAAKDGLRLEAEAVPLRDVDKVWANEGGQRVVFTV